MEVALTQRDPKLVTSALRRCALNAERCVQRMRLSDIVLSVSTAQRWPPQNSSDHETCSNLLKTSQSASSSTGNETDRCLQCCVGIGVGLFNMSSSVEQFCVFQNCLLCLQLMALTMQPGAALWVNWVYLT